MVHPKQNDLINKTKDQLIPLIRSKKQNEMKASYQNKLETVLNQIQDWCKLATQMNKTYQLSKKSIEFHEHYMSPPATFLIRFYVSIKLVIKLTC